MRPLFCRMRAASSATSGLWSLLSGTAWYIGLCPGTPALDGISRTKIARESPQFALMIVSLSKSSWQHVVPLKTLSMRVFLSSRAYVCTKASLIV